MSIGSRFQKSVQFLHSIFPQNHLNGMKIRFEKIDKLIFQSDILKCINFISLINGTQKTKLAY